MMPAARLAGRMLLVWLLAITVVAAEEPSSRETASATLSWSELPPLPQTVGVAGAFVGVSNNALLVAGGANFPSGRPWDGATKVWHDTVYVLTDPTGSWQIAPTKLPRPLGYGVAVTTPDGVACLGGADGERHYADAFLLRWTGDDVQVEPLPPLPQPLAYACGASLGSTIYLAGGTTAPDATEATSTFLTLDLASGRDRHWRSGSAWPGPSRILATAGTQDGAFYLVSGVELRASHRGEPERVQPYLADAYRFVPGRHGGQWTRIADLPEPRAAAPSPMLPLGVSHLALLGGDDGTLSAQLEDAHPGFRDEVFSYHTITDTWSRRGHLPKDLGSDPAAHPEEGHWPPVTTGTAYWQGRFVIPTGEARPGVRTHRVLAATPASPKADFRTVDYGVLAVYLGGLALLGAYFARREHGTDDFFLGGRRVPWWAAAISIFGTQLSAITFLAIPAKAFATDWVYAPLNFGVPLVAGIAAAFYLPFFRRLNVTTAYEYLEHRFHLWTRLFASAAFVAFQIGRMAIVLVLPSLTLAAVTGLDLTLCVIVMGVLTTVYTALGGIEAVIWTDVLQVIILAGGAVLALLVAVAGAGDGAFAAAASAEKLRLFDMAADWTGPAIWVIVLGAIFQNLMPYTADQSVVQRYLTPRDERQAARAIWAGGLLAIPATLLFFSIGTALYAYYRSQPERLGVLASGDQIFAWFIVQELPPGVSGLLVAAVFAAAMSSLDSGLNAVSAVVTTDFYRRFRPRATDRGCLRLARGLTIVLGGVVTAAGVWLGGAAVRSLWDAFFSVIGLLGGTTAGLFLLGIFSRRANAAGAAVGVVASAGAVAYVALLTDASNLLYVTIGIVACAVAGWLASLPLDTRAPAGLTAFELPTRSAADG